MQGKTVFGTLVVLAFTLTPFRADTGPPAGFTDAQLQDLVAALNENNPTLRASEARSRSERHRAPQRRALPDPELRYRFFARTPETRVGPQTQAVELSQALPWAGKRRLQAERALAAAAGSEWDVEELRLELTAQLKRSYAEVAYLQEALAINAEEEQLLQRFESIALRRYSTGEGIQQSVLKVQTDISRLQDRRTSLQEQRDREVRRIAELIGRTEQPLSLQRIRLPLPGEPPEEATLERIAEKVHPSVLALESRIEADRLWSRRRELERRPDFRVGLGYTQVDRRDDAAASMAVVEGDGKDIVALTVGISIPLRRASIRAGVSEARESARARTEALRAERNRLRLGIQQSVVRLHSIAERTALYREVIIPQAETALASSEAAYTTNRQGFLDLLDAERIVFQVRLDHQRLVADYWIAHAMLERSVGRALDSESLP